MEYRFEPGTEPAVLALHGTGGNEDSLSDVARFVFPDSAILSPRGQSLDEGVPRFFRRLREGVFDQADMEAKTHALAAFLESQEVKPPYNLIGYSNGANMGLSLLFRRPELLSKLVLLRPMVPFEPGADLNLSHASILLCSGRTDSMVSEFGVKRLETVLQQRGAKVALHWVNGGHNLSREELEVAKGWARSSTS